MKYTCAIIIALITLYLCCGTTEEDLNPVDWQTNQVSLEADHFFTIADGDTFFANVSGVEVSSDPGDSLYCSLEITWYEKGVEMRLYIYFYSDGVDWWSDEFRTYDGKTQAEWIYYYGRFFESPVGTAFTGDFEEASSDTGNTYTGKVYFQNLTLQAFLDTY
ncbi:hypothetical protein KAT67_05000 [candidate division WOR-3 bacterium]|nr:hypothetical protein [candidate division WOR-3 bacterium]